MTDTAKHICRVGTARIDYRDRVGQRVVNTTVKSGTGLGAVHHDIGFEAIGELRSSR